MRRPTTLLLILSALLVLLAIPAAAQDESTPDPAAATDAPEASAEPTLPPLPTAVPSSDGPVVQGVFFFSPTCGHCEFVIGNTLPPLFAENGGEAVITFDESVLPDQPAFYLMSNGHLQLLMVDSSTEDGSAMFTADSVRLDIDRAGVPRLDYDESAYLVGSGEIPDEYPGIVEEGLAGEGIPWPPVPGLENAIAPFIAEGSVLDPGASPGPTETAAADATAEATDDPAGSEAAVVIPVGPDEDPLDKIGNDPVGNGVSILMLIVLVISLIAAPVLAIRGSLPTFPGWIVIVLVVIGIGVAAYLASVETSGEEAVCGPVGDCNAVQESEYAKLFGIPIGVLGIIGYLLIGGLWLTSRFTEGAVSDWSEVLLAAGAFGGTLFSAYLTFLEPFVIGATCMWCITSAVTMVVLLWVTAGPGWAAFQRLRGAPSTAAPTGS